MSILQRLFGDPEQPLTPNDQLVPDIELAADAYDRMDEGDADGQAKADE